MRKRLTGTLLVYCAGNVSSEMGIAEKICAILERIMSRSMRADNVFTDIASTFIITCRVEEIFLESSER
jgi:hypothetical protein